MRGPVFTKFPGGAEVTTVEPVAPPTEAVIPFSFFVCFFPPFALFALDIFVTLTFIEMRR